MPNNWTLPKICAQTVLLLLLQLLILLQLIFLWWLNYSYLRLMLFVGIVLGIGSEAHSSYNSCLHS